MIKGAVFTIGVLATLIGFGLAALNLFAAGMSDAPPGPTSTGGFAIIGAVGVAMCISAFFIP